MLPYPLQMPVYLRPHGGGRRCGRPPFFFAPFTYVHCEFASKIIHHGQRLRMFRGVASAASRNGEDSTVLDNVCLLAAGFAALALGLSLLPMRNVRLQIGNLLATDPTTLAPATLDNEVALIIAPFTLSEDLTIGSLTLGSTNGLGALSCATGSQEIGIDPVSQAQILTIVPGAVPGFRWLTSGTFTAPITIYGYALCTNAAGALLAAQSLPVPITVSEAGYQINLDPVDMTFVLSPVS
jgi:hypothetical protein